MEVHYIGDMLFVLVETIVSLFVGNLFVEDLTVGYPLVGEVVRDMMARVSVVIAGYLVLLILKDLAALFGAAEACIQSVKVVRWLILQIIAPVVHHQIKVVRWLILQIIAPVVHHQMDTILDNQIAKASGLVVHHQRIVVPNLFP
jgi:hypothetical protein